MKFGNGIVKKYSREYNRTLKNGERKKYTTEQIQITVPKNEDIYENKEEVLIIPNSQIEEFKSREEEIETLKIANFLYVEEVNKLERQLEESNSAPTLEFEKEIEDLKAEIAAKDNALNEIETLKAEIAVKDNALNEIETLKAEIAVKDNALSEIDALKAEIAVKENALSEMKDKYETLHTDTVDVLKRENEQIKDKHSKLIIENENLKTKFVNIKTENENLKTKYSSIKEENRNLKTKCSNLKEEHATVKESYTQVSRKYDHLKQENLNTKTSYAEIFELNEELEKDYDSLRLEYNDLVDKFNDLQDELYHIKTAQNHDAYMANKFKEFMLKRS